MKLNHIFSVGNQCFVGTSSNDLVTPAVFPSFCPFSLSWSPPTDDRRGRGMHIPIGGNKAPSEVAGLSAGMTVLHFGTQNQEKTRKTGALNCRQ